MKYVIALEYIHIHLAKHSIIPYSVICLGSLPNVYTPLFVYVYLKISRRTHDAVHRHYTVGPPITYLPGSLPVNA